MKRMLIPFVAAFGLSLGIATGAVMMRAPKAAAVAKTGEPKPDFANAAAANAAAANAAAAKHDTSSKLAAALPDEPGATQATSATAGVAGSMAGSMAGSTPAAAPVLLASAQVSPTRNEAVATATPQDTITGRKLAKVFGAMQARDAARVLEQMDDSDVRAILASLSNKQQAAILGTFPTQRAATIMRATLRDVGGEQ